MMNPQIKQRWVAALRSGEYKQGIHYLNNNNHFCCLGVLCDVVKDEIGGYWDEHGNFCTDEEIDNCGLIEPVISYCGLTNSSPTVTVDEKNFYLTNLNDSHLLSFKEIADIIEEKL